MPSRINSTTTSPGGLISTGDSDNSLLIQTGDTTAITVNSAQVVSLTNPLPVASGGTGGTTGLTALNASNLTSGTVPDARFPATLPAASGANLTALNANNITSGTVPTARLGSGTADSTTFLRGDSTFAAIQGGPNPLHGRQVFTTSGTYNVPAGVTAVKVTVIGAGGNGGAGTGAVCSGGSGGGGGAGGYIVDYVAVTAGGTASVSVGTNAGTRASSFVGGTTITASGGSNGVNGTNNLDPRSGASGASTIFGQTYYSAGSVRQNSSFPNAYNSSASVSTSANQPIAGGQIYNHGFGAGGNGPAPSNASYNGVGYGAGGAGGGSISFSQSTSSGTGTNGLVIVEW